MTRLEILIQELCPDGVEYKTIGEIATDIFCGSGIKREQVTETGTPCVRYGEIYTTYGVWFDICVSHTDESIITSKKYFEHGDILFAITGESVEDIAKCTAYIGKERCLAGGDIVVLRHNQDPKYLSYALSTMDAQKQKSKGKVKSKVVHSNVPAIKDLIVPIPPLPIQREIVRILDNFTELTEELTEELTARKKQYAYYRDSLLSFNQNDMGRFVGTQLGDLIQGLCPDGVEYKMIGKIATITRGRMMSKDYIKENQGEYAVYSSQTENNGEFGRISTYDFDGEYLTWTTDGANAGSVFYRNGKFSITNVCGLIKALDGEILTRFLYYTLSVEAKKYVNSGMGNPKLMSNVMAKVKIPVPPLPIQREIVRILDQFDTICNDLTSGLPAEIEARKKQYAYYRDKLLTFKEASI